jgi:hypothetical protein
MTFTVDGAAITAASNDPLALVNQGTSLSQASAVFLVTGLSAGAHTFTAKYRVSGGTGTFVNRRIAVIPLG